MLKKISIVFLVSLMIISITGCSSLKKAKSKVSVSDVKNVARMINMDFGKGPNGPFDVKKTASSKPILIIDNQTDRTITVKAQGPDTKTFVVKTKKQQSAKVSSGAYHFVATAPDVKGCEGDVELKKFNEYTWVFVIR